MTAPDGKVIGQTIRKAREAGLTFRHRPSGWTVYTPNNREHNFFASEAEQFVAFVERYAARRKGGYASLPDDVKVLAQALHDVMEALGFDMDGDTDPGAEIAGANYDLEVWSAGIVDEVRSYVDDVADVNELAALIREVDGNHSLGAGALAEALIEKGVRL